MSVTSLMTKVRNLRSQSIALRRGDSTLAAQTMRIERTSRGRIYDVDRTSERRADAVINAATDADIEVGDRFNDENGVLMEVSFIRPNRTYATFAEAVVTE